MNVSPSISAFAWLGLLLRTHRDMLRGRLAKVRGQSRLLQTVLGTFIIGYVVAAYLLFYHGLAFVHRFPLVGSMLSQRILYLLFAFFFLMLTFSNLIIGYSTLFRNRETAWFVTLPVAHAEVARWKWLECLVLSTWALVFLSAPLMAAYGRLYEVGWSFYPFVALLYVPFVVLPALLGVLLILLLVRLLVQPWLGKLLLLGGVVGLAWWFWQLQPAAEVNRQVTAEALMFEKLLRHSQIVINPWLPSTWLVQALLNWKDGTTAAALFYFGVLASNALLAGWLSTIFGSRLFYGSLGAAFRLQSRQSRNNAAATTAPPRPWTERLLAWLPVDRQFATLALKDARVFRRDPAQWSQCVIFFGLLALYFSNLRNMKLNFDQPFWPTLIGYLNLLSAVLTLSTLTTRFVFPQFSLEGKRLWILGLAPLGLPRVITQKFWTSTLAAAAVTLPLMFLSGSILKQSWLQIGFFLIASVLAGASLSALSASFGALFPNLKEDNPTKIVSGFGGTFCLICSFLYILVFTALLAVPSVAAYTPALAAWHRWSVPCMLLAVLWSGLNILLPLRLARERVKTLEF